MGIAEYLAMLISLIEGRQVGIAEIQILLKRIKRQHSIAHGRVMDYDDGEHKKSPP